MITVTVVGILVAFAALAWFGTLQARVVLSKIEELERPVSAPMALPDPEVLERLDIVEKAIGELTLAVSEGIEHASRSERRVRAVVASAKRRMEQAGYIDEGLEAEAEQLRLDYEAESGGEELPAMPEDLANGRDGEPSPWSVVPGIENVRG